MFRREFSLFMLPVALVLAQKGAPVNDNTLFDEVRRRLANDPDVKGGAFDVDVRDGVVTIKGKVETEKVKAKAERVVKKVKGVKSVVNELRVEQRVS